MEAFEEKVGKIMSKIKNFVRKIIYGYKADSKSYEEYLKKIGVSIGENFKIYYPSNTVIDLQNPYLLKIGNNVSLTGPVTIMTHDYSWKVFKIMDGRILGNQRPVLIGNNVFIGWGATILSGAVIEDNVIIGAGAVITSRCEKNSVYAGSPAKRIMSIDEFIAKRERKQVKEAQDLFMYYKETYNEEPPMNIFDSYFPIFTSNENIGEICNTFENRLKLENTEKLSIDYLKQGHNQFSSYEEFRESVRSIEENKKND